MSMKISTNVAAINAARLMDVNNRRIDKSYSELASGSRLNKAADDAAGLAISETMKAQIRSVGQAKRNAGDGISMIQTTEGGLVEISDIIVRLRELAMQSSSSTISDVERVFVQDEVSQLSEELQRIAQSTKWGTSSLLDGSSSQFDFQVGTNNDEFADRIQFDSGQNVATLDALGLDGLDYTTQSGAQSSLVDLDEAQNQVSSMRSKLGALQNRLISTVNNLGVTEENLSAAKSRIADVDVAQATSDLTKNQILLQANTATLAQANQKNELALQLLG